MNDTFHEPELACNVQAIPAELRATHSENTQRIFSAAQETRILPTGYALRLPNEPELLQTIAAFLGYEQLCCPFFRFRLDIEPAKGALWLAITGDVDVKPFLQSEKAFALLPTPAPLPSD